MSINTTLSGKTAIVAGGGRGIGAGVAEYLAESDANVVVVDKLEERAGEVAQRITSKGGQAIPVVADLLNPDDSEMIVGQARERFGTVDVLANVAGGAWAYVPYRRMHEIRDEEWQFVQGLNLGYVFTLCRSAVRAMLEQGTGGSIVNIASIAGVFTSPNSSSYGAAKAGVISFTRTLAHEYAAEGIRANCVAPGRIETPAASSSTLGKEDYFETIPMGFVGDPLDIAKAVLFFASDLASYVTGQLLLVDGGASTTAAIMPFNGPQRISSDEVRGTP